MPRKILLSFLGNSRYKECIYESKAHEFKSPVVRFVQEAVVQMHCGEWTSKDRVFIFLTEEAKENNWQGGFYDDKKEGLEYRLKQLGLQVGIKSVCNLPKGFSEEEIWQIFDLFYDKMGEGDEVYFDITHGFRSLPMLGMVLMNYGKALKGIQLKSITYGAFEALGPGYNMETRLPDPKGRVAPLLDLTGFNEVQNWSIASDNFVQSGDASKIVNLTRKTTAPILLTTKGKSISARTLNLLSVNLKRLSGMMFTNRGKDIVDGKIFKNIEKTLDDIYENRKIIPALRPILEKIKQKVSSFNTDTPNWILAVHWCIDHGLIQQGITQLQEGLLTHFCKKEHNGVTELDYSNEVDRTIISQALLIAKKDIPPENWYAPAAQNIGLVQNLLTNKKLQALISPYESLSQLRNDINHGGYLSTKMPDNFRIELEKKFTLIKAILEI